MTDKKFEKLKKDIRKKMIELEHLQDLYVDKTGVPYMPFLPTRIEEKEMLSCDCGYYDNVNAYYFPPEDFTTPKTQKRDVRVAKELILKQNQKR